MILYCGTLPAYIKTIIATDLHNDLNTANSSLVHLWMFLSCGCEITLKSIFTGRRNEKFGKLKNEKIIQRMKLVKNRDFSSEVTRRS